MSAGTWGWLVLGFPLAGSIVIALGWKFWPGKTPGWIGTLAILAVVRCAMAPPCR